MTLWKSFLKLPKPDRLLTKQAKKRQGARNDINIPARLPECNEARNQAAELFGVVAARVEKLPHEDNHSAESVPEKFPEQAVVPTAEKPEASLPEDTGRARDQAAERLVTLDRVREVSSRSRSGAVHREAEYDPPLTSPLHLGPQSQDVWE